MNCRACEYHDLDTVLTMAPIPVAGDFKATRDEALRAERFPMRWLQCRQCGLVNVGLDMEPDWRDYSYRASDVPALRRHHRDFAAWLQDRFPNTRLHVEIGGNDGVLTKYLRWQTINVDPSDAWVGPGVNEPFSYKVARRMPKADLVTSSNSFAHFGNISDALQGVRHVLRGDGVFVVEVHDLDATLASGQWDTIYHEHAVEWDEDSLRNAGRLHGLRLEHVERLSLHGGLLRAVFRPDMPRKALPVVERDFRPLQLAYDSAAAPFLPDGSVAYGAAARATVRILREKPNIIAVVDGSPRRQGRWVPGTGIPIIGPDEFARRDPPAAYITAIGHERDIKARHPDYGRWVECPTSSS